MNIFLKKYKKWWVLFINSLLALIFTKGVKAQYNIAPEYGVSPTPLYGVSMPVPLYGVTPPPPGEVLLRISPFIVGVFLIFVLAPIIGLTWYYKRGGKKKWPGIIVWTLFSLFVIALIALVTLIYFSYYSYRF